MGWGTYFLFFDDQLALGPLSWGGQVSPVVVWELVDGPAHFKLHGPGQLESPSENKVMTSKEVTETLDDWCWCWGASGWLHQGDKQRLGNYFNAQTY